MLLALRRWIDTWLYQLRGPQPAQRQQPVLEPAAGDGPVQRVQGLGVRGIQSEGGEKLRFRLGFPPSGERARPGEAFGDLDLNAPLELEGRALGPAAVESHR